MLLSLHWLRDYLIKPDVKIDTKELSEHLTMRGIHVSAIKKPHVKYENIVVGRIEQIDKHPDADKLQVTQVTTAEGEKRQIVCGAKNIAVGDIVPVALPGAHLPAVKLDIKVSKIRGVESFGMICSAKELGISDDSEGILQLPKHNSHPGQPLSALLGGGSDDQILEFELTPNRGDCLSVLGLAREISPLIKTKLREPKPAKFRVTPHRTSTILKVEVEDEKLCPRYVARVIDTLKVGESPDWIKQRLEAIGLRPINNIVDVTNFVMFECGQPLHAFDLKKVTSGVVRVAPCHSHTEFTLLTGETVNLIPGDVCIWNGDKPIALAGIMGGLDSQVTADTTSILLESAAFNPVQIRKTAKRLGLMSDSSKRFEKGVDLLGVALASERAAALIRDMVNANVYHPPIDTKEDAGKEETISVDMRDIRKLTGHKNMSTEVAAELLDSIGIQSTKKSINILNVKLPSYRPDLKAQIDVVEEVARLNGYDSIPQHYPISISCYDKLDESQFEFEIRAKKILCSLGLHETIHYSFTSEEQFRKYGIDLNGAVSLHNPISDEMKVLRTSLLPSLLQTYDYNRNRKASNQKLFEVARTYVTDQESETKVKETPHVAALLSGNLNPQSWRGGENPVDFYTIKGLAELLVGQLTTVYLSYEPVKNSVLFHPHRAATIKLGLAEIGVIGEIHPFIKQNTLDTTEPVVLFELNLEALKKYERTGVKYKPLSKFPAVDLDLALLVDKHVTSRQLMDNIKHVAGPLLTELRPFDLYEGENIPSGKKSLAYHLVFQSPERTLQDKEVIELRTKVVGALKEKFNADLRA